MSQIQKAPKTSIFAQEIQRQSAIRQDPTITFFRRLNRPRNNTFNHVQLAKFIKIKYPLVAAIFVTLGYDYVMHYYTEAPQGH